MKKSLYKTATLSLIAGWLLNGCSGAEVLPNNATQTGAATGALTGAVIGYNTKGSHKGRRAAIGAATGALVGGAIGNAIDNQNPPPENSGGWQ